MIVRVQLAIAQAGLAIAFLLVCALQPAPAQSLPAMTPECRRIKTPDIVNEAAQRALDSMRLFTAKQGQVGKAIPARIDVVLIDDALQSEVDSAGCRRSSERAITPDTLLRLPIEHPGKVPGELDRWSVRGICAAAASEIRCSATAIELMLAKDESSSFSPTLQYVLGHEVAHIVLGHSLGSLASTEQSTSASSSASSRLAAALDVCSNEGDAVAREAAADELALKLLKQELSARAIRDDRTFDGFRAVHSWWLWTAGQSGRLQRGRAFCQYIRSGLDGWQLPTHHGSHPRVLSRLARVAASSGVIDAVAIGRSAQIDDRFAENFCQQAHAFEAKQMKCDDADAAGSWSIQSTDSEGNPVTLLGRDAPNGQAAMQDQTTLPSDLPNKLCSAYPEYCPSLKTAFTKCNSGQMPSCNELAEVLGHGLRLFNQAAVVYGYACYRDNPESCMHLAVLHRVGALGGTANGIAARKFFSKACALGSAEGCLSTAALYYEDINLPRIYTLGLLARGCAGGVSRACERQKELTSIVEELRRTTQLPFSFLPFSDIPLR
jgi:hypothetical protein